MSKSIGEKIKYFRKRARKSQIELENSINASQGSISRIESGQINPTKETILKICEALNLTDHEKSYVFSVNPSYVTNILRIVNEFTKIDNLDYSMQKAVDLISKELNYINVAIFFLEENELLRMRYVCSNNFTLKSMQAVGKKITDLYISEEIDKDNLILRSALDNKVHISDSIYPFGRGVVPKPVTKIIQFVTKANRSIVVPINVDNQKIGAMFLTKESETDYSYELDLLKLLATQVGIHARRFEEFIV